MWRVVLGLVVGALAGSAVTYVWLGAAALPGGALVEMPTAVVDNGVVRPARTGPVVTRELDALIVDSPEAPDVALREALAIRDPASRHAAAERAVTAWARADPREALAEIAAIADPALKTALHVAVLRGWRAVDSAGMLDYLRNADFATRRQAMMSGALHELARSDPSAVAAFAESLPLGQDRSDLLNMVANAYAAHDADAALAWAQGVAATDPNVMAVVIAGIAQQDPLRAFELALASDSTQQRFQGLASSVSQIAARDDAQTRQVAERILALGADPQTAQLLQLMVMSWSGRSPAAAMDWLLLNAQRVPPTTFRAAAEPMAFNDPAAAERYIDRVPAESRPHWVAAVAQSYARSDLPAALRFVEQFRGDPAYAQATVRVAQVLAQYDPRAAAELVSTAGMQLPEPGAMAMIAQQWAMREPRAAADWVRGLSAPVGSMLVGNVVRAWAAADARAAQDWVMELPAGGERDTALTSLIMAPMGGAPDAALMSAFSDPRARERAVVGAVAFLAATNPEAGRRLIDDYVTDPSIRAMAEQRLERAGNGGFMPALSAMPVQMPIDGAYGISFGVSPPPGLSPASVAARNAVIAAERNAVIDESRRRARTESDRPDSER